MRHDRRGFTLIELIVVVLIIGILAAFGIPQYLRTVESSKADDAVSTINMIGTTNKMFALDHQGVYVAGQFTSACGAGACPAVAPPGPYNGACALVYCKYLQDQDWATRPYDYYACNGAAAGACGGLGGGNQVSGAKRKAAASSPYNSWGYTMNTSGAVTGYGTTVPAPSY